jgi:hypothetical protein
MIEHHSRFKRMAITGFSAATLALSLLLPANALAYPITVHFDDSKLALQANVSKDWQSTSQSTDPTLTSTQKSKVDQSQPNTQKASASFKAEQTADLQSDSQAQIDTYSGDAMAYGPSTTIGIKNWQSANASANGKAVATNDTGDANGYTGDAYANGGSIDQQNTPSTGDGGNAKSSAKSKTIAPAKANGGSVSTGAAGDGGTSTASGSSSKSSAHGGEIDDPSADGGSASSHGNSTASATATGGSSGSNNGADTNTASADGGSASNMAYGGNTGRNSASAVLAGGTADNGLTVKAMTQGNATAMSGNASNTGDATSTATTTATQKANPSNWVSLRNTPSASSSVSQSDPQIATSTQTSTNSNGVTQTNTTTSTPH